MRTKFTESLISNIIAQNSVANRNVTIQLLQHLNTRRFYIIIIVLFLLLPSFILISNIDDNLPPYLAGIPPLYNFKSFTASGLKTDKKHGKQIKKRTKTHKINMKTKTENTLKQQQHKTNEQNKNHKNNEEQHKIK